METVTGRMIADAKVNTLPDERQVVNFRVALNACVKPKNATEVRQYTTYVNCAYWISPKIAERLTKGALVEIAGRLTVTAYTNMQGEAKGSLNCHVDAIKVHQQAKGYPVQAEPSKQEVTEDLPF